MVPTEDSRGEPTHSSPVQGVEQRQEVGQEVVRQPEDLTVVPDPEVVRPIEASKVVLEAVPTAAEAGRTAGARQVVAVPKVGQAAVPTVARHRPVLEPGPVLGQPVGD